MSNFRDLGNSLYRNKDYNNAAKAYSDALIEQEQNGSSDSIAIILGNRSASYLAMMMYVEAESDARMALTLDKSIEKNYYRLFMALKGLKRIDDASAVLQEGLTMFPTSDMFLKLQTQISARNEEKRNKSKQKLRGFLNEKFGEESSSEQSAALFDRRKRELDLNPARDGAIILETVPGASCTAIERSMIQEVRKLIKKIQMGEFGEIRSYHHLSGVFKQLCDRDSLRESLFPGIPPAQCKDLPQTLKEVLLWRELILDITKIAKSAAEVLENVKRKAASTGDCIDRDSESMLCDQIVQEALAREVVLAVRRLSKQISQISARVSLSLASPSSEQAQLNQLDDDIPLELLRNKIACQEEFLGEEWASLIVSDITRFVAAENMAAAARINAPPKEGEVPARMAYIDLKTGSLEEYYPALAEALMRIQALPYELNAKLDNQLQLLEPTKGCTLLLHYPRGSRQDLRLDNVNQILSDSGIRLSCAYHVMGAADTDSEVGSSPVCQFTHASAFAQSEDANGPMHDIDVVNDQLILHQSIAVKNQRSTAARDYYVVMFMCHAQLDAAAV